MINHSLLEFLGARLACAVLVAVALGGYTPDAAGQISTDPEYRAFMEDGGDWLLPLQRADGSFPWTSSAPDSIFINVQAPIGFGLLSAWRATGRADFRDAAIKVGDYLIANQAEFPSGHPVFRSYDAYFLVRLSTATGISSYSDHVQTFFWDRLQAGNYGPDADWDIADYVAAEIARRGGQAPTGEVVAAWDLALVTVAADVAGIDQFDDALMAGVRKALADAPDETFALGEAGYDVLGLVGGVWAAGTTGRSAVPAGGLWGDVGDNQELAEALLAFQSDEGAFVQSSLALESPIDPANTVSQHTAFAMLALQALDGQQFAPELGRALDSLTAFQGPDGRIDYYHPSVDPSTVPGAGDVLTHGYALQAFAEIQEIVAPSTRPIPMLGWPSVVLLVLAMALAAGLRGRAPGACIG